MPISIGLTDYTAEEIAFLTSFIITDVMDTRAVALGRIDCPSYNYIMAKAQRRQRPLLNGSLKFNVKGERGQQFTWWDGTDILPFESRQTAFQLEFACGRAHYGDEEVYAFLRNQGINVDYRTGLGIRSRDELLGAPSTRILLNYLVEKAEDIERDWDRNMAQHIWRSNAATTKCFIGIDGMVPLADPSLGLIGGLSRTNPLLQHNVMTGLTAANFFSNVEEFIRTIEDQAGGRRVNLITVGDNVWTLWIDILTGSNSSGTSRQWELSTMMDGAYRDLEGMKIGFPRETFRWGNALVMREPQFKEIQRLENSANSWLDRMYFLCTDVIFPLPTQDRTVVPHPMPYNQRLERCSYHGEMMLVANMPQANGVAILA